MLMAITQNIATITATTIKMIFESLDTPESYATVLKCEE